MTTDPFTTALSDAEWRAFQAIPDQGYSHRGWVDHKIAGRVRDALAQEPTDEEVLAALNAQRWDYWGDEPEESLADHSTSQVSAMRAALLAARRAREEQR